MYSEIINYFEKEVLLLECRVQETVENNFDTEDYYKNKSPKVEEIYNNFIMTIKIIDNRYEENQKKSTDKKL